MIPEGTEGQLNFLRKGTRRESVSLLPYAGLPVVTHLRCLGSHIDDVLHSGRPWRPLGRLRRSKRKNAKTRFRKRLMVKTKNGQSLITFDTDRNRKL
jgi:hypothetical protein